MLQSRKGSDVENDEGRCTENVPPPKDVEVLKAGEMGEAKKMELFAIKRVDSFDCLFVDQSESNPSLVVQEEVVLSSTFDLQGGDAWTPTYEDGGGLDFDVDIPS